MICRHRAYRLLTVSFFFARSLLVRVTIFCASSMVSTESFRPPNQPIPLVHRAGAVCLYVCRVKLKIVNKRLTTRVVDVSAGQSSGGDCCDLVNRVGKREAPDKKKRP